MTHSEAVTAITDVLARLENDSGRVVIDLRIERYDSSAIGDEQRTYFRNVLIEYMPTPIEWTRPS